MNRHNVDTMLAYVSRLLIVANVVPI